MATSLSDIDGIGDKTADNLREIGIETVSDLAKADVSLIERAGLSKKRALDFKEEAKQNAAVIQSGAEANEYFSSLENVSTGIEGLDEIIGGGWEQEDIVALYGDTNTGKSQLAMKSLAMAVEDTDEPSVYIETERKSYDPERIRNFSTKEDTQEKVYRVTAHGLEEQRNAYDVVLSQFDSIGLLVVDSFTARFRKSDDFGGLGSHSDRSQEMKEHLNKLEEISSRLKCPVLIVCQIYENSDPFGGGGVVMYGGSLLRHDIGFSVQMKKAGGEIVEANVEGQSSTRDTSVELAITDSDIVEN